MISKKTLSTASLVVGMVSGLILVLMLFDYLSGAFISKPMLDHLSGDILKAARFAKWTSLAIAFAIIVTLVSGTLMLFVRNRIFNIVSTTVTLLAIVLCIIICHKGGSYNYVEEDVAAVDIVTMMTSYQSSLFATMAALFVPFVLQIFATINSFIHKPIAPATPPPATTIAEVTDNE